MFSKIARKVCEGQQLDMDFPNQENVTIDQYMGMIENKTAVFFGSGFAIATNASRGESFIIGSI
jgi:geranylgeranyl diphosphate synthase type II